MAWRWHGVGWLHAQLHSSLRYWSLRSLYGRAKDAKLDHGNGTGTPMERLARFGSVPGSVPDLAAGLHGRITYAVDANGGQAETQGWYIPAF